MAALIEPRRHAGKTYRPTGPALLSARDMAAILSRVLGRRVRHIDMPMWMYLKAMRALGVSAFEQSGVRHYIEDHKRGAFEFGAPTDHVLEVTGRPPRISRPSPAAMLRSRRRAARLATACARSAISCASA